MSGPECRCRRSCRCYRTVTANAKPGQDAQLPGHHAAGTVVFVTMTPSGSRALAACGAQGETAGTDSTRQNLHFPAPSFGSGSNLFAW